MSCTKMGYHHSLQSDINNILLKSQNGIRDINIMNSPPPLTEVQLPAMVEQQQHQPSNVSPASLRISITSPPDATLPPLDPHLYYQSQQQPQQPQQQPQQPQQQPQQQQQLSLPPPPPSSQAQQFVAQSLLNGNLRVSISRRNTEPIVESNDTVSNQRQQQQPQPQPQPQQLIPVIRNPGITLPPLSTIAPNSISSPSSLESRSRNNSFAAPSGQSIPIIPSPASKTSVPIPQQPPQQQQGGFNPQHLHPTQLPSNHHQHHQQQQQQQGTYIQASSSPYPIYTSLLPIPNQNNQEFQYPGYGYPQPYYQQKEQQLPMPVMYQAYSAQYGQPMYLLIQPQNTPPGPLTLPPQQQQQQHQRQHSYPHHGPSQQHQHQHQPQGPPIHQIMYHHPGFSFASIDNTKKTPRRRTRTGCLTCRKRRIKCDERKPHCSNCEKSRKVCLGYEQPPFQNRNRKYKEGSSIDNEESDDAVIEEENYTKSSNSSTKERLSAVN